MDHVGRTQATEIAAELRSKGFEAWLVGGCVRDLVLGREPADYDISTDATPSRLLEMFPHAQFVGAQFGVVLVDGVEVATFRSDHSYQDGRHPTQVTFETDVKRDVLRRDFTINALLLDPESLRLPAVPVSRIVDYVGGLDDLERHRIRAIGDPEQRFDEDHLRMLRAIRFAARFGFEIEGGTWAAIQKLHARILRVSPERIRDELDRILTEGAARRGFELLDASGLLERHTAGSRGDAWRRAAARVPSRGRRLDAYADHAGRASDAHATLAWGVLLHDVGKPGTFRSPIESALTGTWSWANASRATF